MTDIIWKDPPPPNRGGTVLGKTAKFVAALRANPGRWALYRSAKTCGTVVYRRQYPGTEWTTRRREDGRYDVYARWVGEQP